MNRVLLLLLILFSLIPACKEEPKGEKLAEVNGEILYLESFKATFPKGEWEALEASAKRRYVEDWVNLTLLAQAADEAKLDEDPIIKAKMDFAQKKVKANALISERIARLRISEDQLFSYFRIHQAEFQKPLLSYRIQRISLPDKLTAENVLERINQGMAFNTALSRYSTESLRESGGDMGFVESVGPDSLFWQAAVNLEPEQSGILKKDDLWYVFRITDSKESDSQASFEQHRAEIRRRIIGEKQEEVYRKLLQEIKSRGNEIYYY